LSAKIAAQKPSGRVIPAASPLQSAAWTGVAADQDVSIMIAVATKLCCLQNRRTIELSDEEYVRNIDHLRIDTDVQLPSPDRGVMSLRYPHFSTHAATAMFFK
jgi:hypothetical protein